MRRIVAISILAALLWGSSVPALASFATIGLVVNGQIVITDSPPFVANHRLLVPLRATAEALGYRVEYQDADKSIVLSSANNSEPLATLWLYSNRVVTSGAELTAPFPVLVRSNRSFIPVEFAASLLGFDVKWDGDRSALRITGQGTMNPPTVRNNDPELVVAAEAFCGVNPNKDEESAHLAQTHIWVESAPLTPAEELMVLRAPAQASPGRLNQACAVTVRRATYEFPPGSGRPNETGWLVTYNGLEMYGDFGRGKVNQELHVLIAQNLSPVEGLSYR